MAKLIETEDQFLSIRGDKRIDDYVIKNMTIENWITNFQQIVDVRFENCKFVGGENSFLSTTFKNVSFLECELDGVVFRNCSFAIVRFTNSNVSKCSFERNGWNNVQSYNSQFANCDLFNEMLIGCSFEHGSFEQNNIEGLKHRETGVLFKNVKFEGNYGTMKKI